MGRYAVAPFINNVHKFCLEPGAIRYVLEAEDRARALHEIVLGDAPGWTCSTCGITMQELCQVAGLVGTGRVLSSLVVQCFPRPGAVGHAARECVGEVLYSGLGGRWSRELRDVVGVGMAESIARHDWIVPVLTPHGQPSRYIYAFAKSTP